MPRIAMHHASEFKPLLTPRQRDCMTAKNGQIALGRTVVWNPG
jgi:hypothetical protein